MAGREKVHVRIGRNADGGHFVEVDGVDFSAKVLAEGFGVEFANDPAVPDRVHMIIAADVLDIELPNAVVDALRAESDA